MYPPVAGHGPDYRPLSSRRDSLASSWGCGLTYSWYTEDFQRPIARMSSGLTPAIAALVAPPQRKLCPPYDEGSRPMARRAPRNAVMTHGLVHTSPDNRQKKGALGGDCLATCHWCSRSTADTGQATQPGMPPTVTSAPAAKLVRFGLP